MNTVQIYNKKTLKNNVSYALKNKTSKNKIIFGNIPNEVLDTVKSLYKINAFNRKYILYDNDIRHMYNNHSNIINELKKGQIAIDERDIEKIIDIINQPDKIIKGSKHKNDNTIKLLKQYRNIDYYVVIVIQRKSKYLIIKTMWKKSALANN